MCMYIDTNQTTRKYRINTQTPRYDQTFDAITIALTLTILCAHTTNSPKLVDSHPPLLTTSVPGKNTYLTRFANVCQLYINVIAYFPQTYVHT